MSHQAKYRAYINEHIMNVNKVYTCLLEMKLMSYSKEVGDLIIDHDKSKFDDKEFVPYADKFFGPTKQHPDFVYAWNHHQKANPHHWQYWIMWKPEGSEALKMPYKYIIEMLCDWCAMSHHFNNKPSDWYQANIDKMFLHPDTENEIDSLIPLFDKVWEELSNAI